MTKTLIYRPCSECHEWLNGEEVHEPQTCMENLQARVKRKQVQANDLMKAAWDLQRAVTAYERRISALHFQIMEAEEAEEAEQAETSRGGRA